MILTDKEKMVLTPTYHAFHMFIPFQDATSIPVELKSPEYTLGDTSVPAISASAARGKDGKVYLALVNINPRSGSEVSVALRGVNPSSATGRLLTADAMDAHNTFANPEAIKPVAYRADVKNGKVEVKLPAKSVVVLALE
jgi:Alpha-L-arabinofuranosidase